MAGSWEHMVTGRGRLRNNESFCDMIENLGDAYEAAEECYGMVWYLAGVVVALREDNFGGTERTRQEMLAVVREAQEHYRDGLDSGGVQRSR